MKPRASAAATTSIFSAAEGIGHVDHRAAERRRRGQQRGDVAKKDPRLGKIGDVADVAGQTMVGRVDMLAVPVLYRITPGN